MTFREAVVLLDIEGTTTPIDYVFGVLFPFAAERLPAFLVEREPDVQGDLQALRQEWDAIETGAWPGALPYLQALMAADRKSTALKSLQGKIWEEGYRAGTLQSRVFADVGPALARWHGQGKTIAIFSSGSTQAQELLFRYSQAGDLTPYLRAYFDTRTGPKNQAASYRAIAEVLQVGPEEILFVSDVVAELEAAQEAGCVVRWAVRPGNRPVPPHDFVALQNFDDL
ncbi:MAG TPA: acireductone synthase [Cyanobacteria bacterium UBA8156]|jgi:enolase-phosphatase E1|nr:acireductone synthase [Cyanobacteria bacterium UBA8156]